MVSGNLFIYHLSPKVLYSLISFNDYKSHFLNTENVTFFNLFNNLSSYFDIVNFTRFNNVVSFNAVFNLLYIGLTLNLNSNAIKIYNGYAVNIPKLSGIRDLPKFLIHRLTNWIPTGNKKRTYTKGVSRWRLNRMVKQHLPTPECGESRPTVTCCTHIPQVIFSGLTGWLSWHLGRWSRVQITHWTNPRRAANLPVTSHATGGSAT